MSKTIKISEQQLRNEIKKKVTSLLNEIGNTPNGQYMLGRLAGKRLNQSNNTKDWLKYKIASTNAESEALRNNKDGINGVRQFQFGFDKEFGQDDEYEGLKVSTYEECIDKVSEIVEALNFHNDRQYVNVIDSIRNLIYDNVLKKLDDAYNNEETTVFEPSIDRIYHVLMQSALKMLLNKVYRDTITYDLEEGGLNSEESKSMTPKIGYSTKDYYSGTDDEI